MSCSGGFNIGMLYQVVCVILLTTFVCFAQHTTSPDGSTPPATNPLKVFHVESRTSSITVLWRSNLTLINYKVQARSLVSGITLTAQPINETELTMTDLMIDTPYEICVTADVISQEAGPQTSPKEANGRLLVTDCIELNTIPIVRVDSVLALFGVFAFLVISVMSALMCWKCAQKHDKTATDASVSDYKENGNGLEPDEPETEMKGSPDEAAQPLLASGKSDKVNSQSSLEIESVSETQPQNNVYKHELPSSAERSTAV